MASLVTYKVNLPDEILYFVPLKINIPVGLAGWN